MGEESLGDVLEDAAVRRVRRMLGERTDAVVTIGDSTGRLLWASVPGSRRLFGRTPESLTGRSLFDYVHPDDQASARRHYARALEGEAQRSTARVRTAEGTWRRVSSVAWAVQGRWGTVVVTITTSGDDDPREWQRTVQR